MRPDKFTAKFQQALAEAQSLAIGRDQAMIEPAHLLLALLDQQGGTVKPLIGKAGGNVQRLRSDLLEIVGGLPKVQGTPGEVHVSNDLQRLLNVCDKLAQLRGDQYISSEILVLAALDEKAVLARLLKDAGVSRVAIERAINEVRGGERVDDPNAEEHRQALEKFTVDLTQRAASKGELQRFAQKFGVTALIDKASKRYAALGLGVARYGDEKWLQILTEEPLVLTQPLTRWGGKLTIGLAEDDWKAWVASERTT
ncbi:MAG: Clp protease N-terminal domain-containing protein [Candidatus Limnocylindrus sp.]